MNHSSLSGALIVMVAVAASVASAADRVEIDSKTVYGGQSATLGVYMENDASLNGIYFPFVFRSVSGGAYPSFIAGHYNPNGRLYLTGSIYSDPISGLKVIDGYDLAGEACYDGENGFRTKEGGDYNGYSLQSPDDPDCINFVRSSVLPPTPLSAGTDFPVGTGQPSILIDITVSNVVGTFEIDTTCVYASNHLVYVTANPGGAVIPAFSKSIVTVLPCDCPYQGDFNTDGLLDALDLNDMISVLFFSGSNPQDVACSTSRGDLDDNGYCDAIDLNLLIEHLYFGGPVPTDPCIL